MVAPIQPAPASLLHKERIAQYVSLSPACLATPLPAVCATVFSPLLLSYFPPARGIVLAYEDVELSEAAPSGTTRAKAAAQARPRPQPQQQQEDSDLSASEDERHGSSGGRQLLLKHIDEYSSPFLWATATFLVFRPRRNTRLSATITHQSRTHISLSYLNTFPVSVLATCLPPTWSWHAEHANRMKKGWDGRLSDEGGWWVVEGERVENGTGVEVRIRDYEGRMDGRGRGKGFLRIEGSLLSVEEEREVADAQRGERRA